MVYYDSVANKKTFKDLVMNAQSDKKKSRAVTVRLPPDVDQEIQKLCEKSGRNFTDIVIEALRYALELPPK
jgi:hypothetical protein